MQGNPGKCDGFSIMEVDLESIILGPELITLSQSCFYYILCSLLLCDFWFLQLWVFNVTNPSRQPLSIQPVLLQHYTKSETVIDLFTEHIDPDIDFNAVQTNSFTFSRDHALFDTESSMSDTVIHPGDDPYQVTVAFSPKVDAMADTVLLIRNNLTVLDYVVLKGRGIQGVFSIDGIQPGSDPLEFEFTQTMMEQCHGKDVGNFARFTVNKTTVDPH